MVNKPVFPLRRDLGVQLSVLYLAFVSMVLLAVFLFIRSASDRLENDISTADLALANAIAQETHTTLNSATGAVSELAEYPSVIDNDLTGMNEIFEKAISVRNDVNLIYRLDSSGVMTFHYPVGPESTVGTDFSFRSYFQQATHSREPFISSGRISPTTNQPVATAVMPLWTADNRFSGLVAMNIKLQFLSDTLTKIAATSYQQVQIAIIDGDGQIIAHSNPDFLLHDARQMMPRASEAVLSGQTGNLIMKDRENHEQIYSYAPIQGNGWGVVVSRPTETAFAVITDFRRGTFLVLAVFLSSGLLFRGILSRRVIHPLEKLATLSQEVWSENHQSGDLNKALADFSRRSDQMGTLTRSLQHMQQAIEARLNELTTLLKTGAAVVSTLDSQVVLERILAQVEQLLGVQMSVIFALDEDAHVFRVRASRNLPNWYAEQVMIDPLDPDSVAMRALRTGEPIQISNTETDPSYVRHRNRARMAGYRSLLAIKLPVQHTPAALLMVGRTEPYVFSEREIRLLVSFAHHATMAIENAALYARSDMNLQEQTRRLEALIQSMHDGVVLEDAEGYILYANRRVQELTGLPAEVLYQKPIRFLIDGLIMFTDDSDALETTITRLLSEKGIRHAEFEQNHLNPTRHLSLTLFDVQESKNVLIGRGWILQDTTQRYAIERMRSILIATVSHELRTPLAAIKGYTSTLLADDVEWDSQSQREFLSIISQETDRLSKLVQDLLDMSRIEAGSFILKRQQCSLPELIYRAAQHVGQPERLRIQSAPNLPGLYADPQRLETVIRNLVENAVKYSQSSVYITAFMEGDNPVVRVTDEGPGISPEQQERVFERFYRGETALPGTGLGLAIARSFVQVHGGRIWLESSERGTCVAFTIPVVVELD